MRGRFISLEGPEGCGKSTQVQALMDRLRQAGLRVTGVREPGGTATGDVIRNLLQHDLAGEPLFPETEVLLFAASRAQLVRRVIQPALADGVWVVSDRFLDSTTVYQGSGRGLGEDCMRALNALAAGGTVPDRTLLLDIDVDLSLRRVAARTAGRGETRDRFEREDRAFHSRVRAGYLELARRWPERIRVIDGAGPPDAVAAAIWEALRDLLPPGRAQTGSAA